MTAARRVELRFQDHLIDSYKYYKGYARKWASEWQNGVMDLICTLPGVAVHLTEVKHRPEFTGQTIKNPIEAIQRETAKSFINGGGDVLLCVIGNSTKAIGSYAYWFHPLVETISTENCLYWGKYEPGIGFPVHMMFTPITKARKINGRG